MMHQKRRRMGIPRPWQYFAALFLIGIFALSIRGFCLPLSDPEDHDISEPNLLSPSQDRSVNVRLGPMYLRGQSPFQLLRLSLTPIGGENVPRGHWLLGTTATWTNRWAEEKDKYIIDAGVLRTAFFATYGLMDWLELHLEIPFCMRGGGYMDGMIEGFHDLFGLNQAGRDRYPKNRFRIVFWRKDGTKFELGPGGSGVGMEDMVLSTRCLITRGGEWLPQTCLTLHFKVPTGDEEDLYGSGSLDGGAAFCFGKRIRGLYGYLGIQYTRFGDDELAGIPMRKDQISVLTALEFPWDDRLSFILQELFNTGAAEDFYEFSDPTNEISFGIKAEFPSQTYFEFGLIENLFLFDNSPDFGVHLGISRRF